MPVCFESFMGNREDKTTIFANMVQKDMDKAEDAYRINLRVLLELQSISLDYYKY